MKRFSKISLKILGVLLVLFLLLSICGIVVLYSPYFQTLIIQKVTNSFSEKYNTKIDIKSVSFSPFNHLILNDVYIEDLNQDTLVFAENIDAEFQLHNVFGENRRFELDKFKLINSKINLSQDTSKVFNFDFLLGNKETSKNSKTKSENAWEVNLDGIELSNTKFRYSIPKSELPLTATIKTGFVSFLTFSTKKKLLDEGMINLQAFVNIPADFLKGSGKKSEQKEVEFIPEVFNDWNIHFSTINLIDSKVNFIGDNLPNGIPQKIHAKSIQINELKIDSNRINSIILVENISTNTGFELKSLETKIQIDTGQILANNFALKTTFSSINGAIKIQKNQFANSLDLFDQLIINSTIQPSNVDIRDIEYFTKLPESLQFIKDKKATSIKINGKIKQYTGKITTKNFKINAGNIIDIEGDLRIRDIQTPETAFIDLDLQKLSTNAKNIRNLLAHLNLPENINRFGQLNYNGRVTGFYNDFVSEGTLTSELGNIDLDVNLKLDKEKNIPIYSGAIDVHQFELGKWLEQKDLGAVSLKTKVKGKGLTKENLEINLDGIINSIVFKEYDYKDITIEGKIKENFFDGLATIEDVNCYVNFIGSVDFSDSKPIVNAHAKVNNIDLKALGLSKTEIAFKGISDFNSVGKDIDDFTGKIELSDFYLNYKGDTTLIKDISIISQNINDKRSVEVLSELIDANLEGQFYLKEIIPASQAMINNYYPNTFNNPKIDSLELIQKFSFDISIKEPTNIIQIFTDEVEELDPGKLNGTIDQEAKTMQMNGYFPYFKFKGVETKNIEVNIASTERKYDINISTGPIIHEDTTYIPNSQLIANFNNDSLVISVDINGYDDPYALHLNALLSQENKDTFKFKFLPSDIIADGKQWNIEKRNEIIFSKNFLKLKNIKLEQEEQLIAINDGIFKNGDNELQLNIRNLKVSDFYHFIKYRELEVDGSINGDVTLRNIFKTPEFDAKVFMDSLVINGESYGQLTLNTNSINPKEKIYANGILETFDNQIKIDGNYYPNKKENSLDFDLETERASLKFLQGILYREVEDLQGFFTTNVKVGGNLKKPTFDGKILIEDAAMTVLYTNVRYFADNQTVISNEDGMFIQDFELTDKDGNVAYLTGNLIHEAFRNEQLTLNAVSDKIWVLNTKKKDNSSFYGKGIGKTKILFTGPFNDITMDLKLKSAKGSVIYIPISSSSSKNKYEFIRFTNGNTDTVKEEEDYEVNLKGMKIKIDLDITNEAEVQIIFDEQAGDIIKGYGTGNIQMDYYSKGDFTMYGDYLIEKGDYLFTLQNIINKKFDMSRGGTIVWNGDPYDATLNIDAVYKLRAAPYDFIAEYINTADNTEVITAKRRAPVNLALNLKGSLLNPNVNFKIDTDVDNISIKNYVDAKLRAIKDNTNEINRQVFGLMVLNRFLPSFEVAGQTSSGALAATGVNTTVSEFLSSQLSLYISDAISQLFTDVDFDLNVRTYDANLDQLNPEENFNRNEVRLALGKSFFNDRVKVNVGGNFDFGNSSVDGVNQTQNEIAGDFIIEYSITRDGRVKISGFRVGQPDIYNQTIITKTGIGLSYQEEFDNLNDLFETVKRRKQERKNNRILRKEKARQEDLDRNSSPTDSLNTK